MAISAEPLRLFQVPQGSMASGVVAQASSDEAGSYRFERLPEGEYRLRTVATAAYQPAEITVRTGVDSADLTVSGERQVSVQGLVKDINGKALQGVRVAYEKTPSPETLTDENGGYQLEISVARSNSSFPLKFQLAGYRTESRQLNESDIYGRDTLTLNLNLTAVKSLAVVAGQVISPERTALGGEIVHLTGKVRYQAVTNLAGEFAIPDVEARQSYRLSVPSHSPYRPYVKQVLVGSDGLWQDIVMERGSPQSASLSGRMIDAGGNPLPRFSLWLQSYNREARGPVPVTSDDTGRFAIDEVPLGRLNLLTQSQPRILVTGIDLPEGGAQNIDLILDWGSYQVNGQVVDSQGLPVAGSKVVLSWSHQYSGVQSLSERATVADADGFFRFAQVGPGVHSVRVDVPGFRSTRLQYNVERNSGAVVVQLEGNAQAVLH
jgi:protocatechuate 3,4-dioxygenase beta subunit